MPTYKYNSKLLNGESCSGILEAKNEHDLAKILRSQGEILISTQENQEKRFLKKIKFIPSIRGVSVSEKIFFTRNLKIMISAGVPLPRALKILSQQTRNKKMRRALLGVSEKIIKGNSFSDSLTEYSSVFSELFLNMVKVGEESGTLENVLVVLTKQMEREHELKSKIMGAMIYPAVIISAMTLIGIAMLILVVPKLAQTFTELGIELPLTTRIVIGIGNFLAKFWYLLPVIIFSIFISFKSLLKTKFGKLALDKIVLKIPLISSLVKKTNSAYTARTLSSLISAGVPVVRALEVVSGALTNIYYKEAILKVADLVKKGSKLGEALRGHDDIYPGLIIQMVEVGEETGETAGILEKLADFFEEEVTNAAKNISSVVEPVLMLIIGGVVGFFAISMVQPIYSMVSAF